jgi:hypothetical protein
MFRTVYSLVLASVPQQQRYITAASPQTSPWRSSLTPHVIHSESYLLRTGQISAVLSRTTWPLSTRWKQGWTRRFNTECPDAKCFPVHAYMHTRLREGMSNVDADFALLHSWVGKPYSELEVEVADLRMLRRANQQESRHR